LSAQRRAGGGLEHQGQTEQGGHGPKDCARTDAKGKMSACAQAFGHTRARSHEDSRAGADRGHEVQKGDGEKGGERHDAPLG